MQLTLLLPTAMTHTHTVLVTQGCFPLNPAPSYITQHPAPGQQTKADPVYRSPPSQENIYIFNRLPDTSFFCSAKKTPWLDKGQKAVAEQIGNSPFCGTGLGDGDGMNTLQGCANWSTRMGVMSTHSNQASAGAVPPAWRGWCGCFKALASPSPPSTPVSTASSSSSLQCGSGTMLPG